MIRTGIPPGPLPAAPPLGRASSKNSSELDTTFRELFEFAPVAYHEIDATGILRRVNQTECRMLGYTAAEMVGNPVWQFVAADQQEQCRAQLSVALLAVISQVIMPRADKPGLGRRNCTIRCR